MAAPPSLPTSFIFLCFFSSCTLLRAKYKPPYDPKGFLAEGCTVLAGNAIPEEPQEWAMPVTLWLESLQVSLVASATEVSQIYSEN